MNASSLAIGAILLAAGSGSRLGHRPKSLLLLDGVPLIQRQLIALSGAGVDELVVVIGHHADAIEAAVAGFQVTLVLNPSPDDGQPSSVRIGLEALSPKLDAVIIALADQPLINAQDIAALISEFKKRGSAAMVVPQVSDAQGAITPGNPVMLEATLRDEWLAGDINTACRRWRDDHPDRVHRFSTGNRRYAIDIDTPQDLERFTERTGQVLSWPTPLPAA